MSDIVKVSNGNDWEALYINGEKVASQHLNRLTIGELLVGHTVDSYREVYQPMPESMDDENWVCSIYEYPKKLEDIPNA